MNLPFLQSRHAPDVDAYNLVYHHKLFWLVVVAVLAFVSSSTNANINSNANTSASNTTRVGISHTQSHAGHNHGDHIKERRTPDGAAVADVTKVLHQVPPADLGKLSIDDLRTFVELFDLLRNEHVGQPSDSQLFNAAMTGLLADIDPHAQLYSKSEYSNLLTFTEGEFADIGTEVALDTVQGLGAKPMWRIVSVAPRSPAYFANLNTGFSIERIDDIALNTYTQPADQKTIQQLLRGDAGSFVDIGYTDLSGSTHDVRLVRKNLLNSVVTAEMYGSTLWLNIPSFTDTTAAQVTAAIKQQLSKTKPKGSTKTANQNPAENDIRVVLDLRGNPGGVLPSAIEVAGLFASSARAVIIAYKAGAKELVTTQPDAPFSTLPLVVVMDSQTASAAEVLAVALQNAQTGDEAQVVIPRAVIVGQPSYGKGSIQKVWPLHDGRAVKFTVAYYLSPTGEPIDTVGVMPDIDYDRPLKTAEDKRLLLGYLSAQPKAQRVLSRR